MKEKGFRYNGEVTRLEAGDTIFYNPASGTVSFGRSTNPTPPDFRLHMDGDDKFLFYCIRNEMDFLQLAKLIAVLSGLRCLTVERSTGLVPRWSVTFAE